MLHYSQHAVLAPVLASGSMPAYMQQAPWGRALISCRNCQGGVSGGKFRGRLTMSMLDQDTSTMRMRLEATPIELRRPEIGPQSKARGIYVGVLLGAMAWLLIIALGIAIWGWL